MSRTLRRARRLLLLLLTLGRLGLAHGEEPVGGEPQTINLGSRAMQQLATLRLPIADGAKGRRAAVIVLHPGFAGDDESAASMARQLSSHGILTVSPAYRGQRRALDGERSDGEIEFCSGEVDDAQQLLAWLRQRSDVDPQRIGLYGASHGGCIALRTAIREPLLRAVAVLSAPVAAQALQEHLQAQPFGFFFYNGILSDKLARYVQGDRHLEAGQTLPPRSVGRYAARSPLFLATKLTMPLCLIHGSSDSIVPVDHACWMTQVLRRQGRPIAESWLDREGQPMVAARPLCGLPPPPREVGQPPAPATELWLVEGQDHIFFSAAARRAAEAKAVEFLLRELK